MCGTGYVVLSSHEPNQGQMGLFIYTVIVRWGITVEGKHTYRTLFARLIFVVLKRKTTGNFVNHS